MEYRFSWIPNVPDQTRKAAEDAIRKDQESGHSPITFCHDGIVTVTLASPDPLQMTLVGNMKCSCGKPRGAIAGRSDGSTITLDAVNNSA